MTFGTSAHLALMHSPAPQQAVKVEVAKLLDILGENDPGIVDELTSTPVNHMVLADLCLWNGRLAPNPKRDRISRAATRFFAVQALATTVMRSSALDLSAQYSPDVGRAFATGAVGLFDAGQSQFEMLGRSAHSIAFWIAERKANSVAVIESPIGNSLPVQFLHHLLQKSGVPASVITWNAPRNDRSSRGRTVDETADDCVAATDPDDYVILLDDALSGSRFLKLYEALASRVRSDRLLSIAMVFEDTSRAGLKTHPNRERLKGCLERQALRVGYPKPWLEFPPMRLFVMDDGAPCRWPVPMIWGDCELAAGKRKVNLIFTIHEHCLELLKDLAAKASRFRPYLEQAWTRNTANQGFSFAPGAMQSTFAEIVEQLRFDQFHDSLREKARQRFPDDYTGNVTSMDKDGAEERWSWFRDAFIVAAAQRIGEQRAGFAWRAIDDGFASSFPHRKPRSGRDEDAAAYTLPFNDTITAFNRQLLAKLDQVTISR